jgi:RecA-family ATPase
MHLQTLSRRLRVLSNGLDIDPADCAHLPFFATSREGLSVHESTPPITGYDVVIVESLRRVLVGNENQACDIAAFWRNATRIFKGSTLLLSHHMNKPYEGVRSRDRASGSTDIMAGCDAAFAVTRTGTSSARIECVRSRVAEEAPPFNVKVQSVQDSLLITRAV